MNHDVVVTGDMMGYISVVLIWLDEQKLDSNDRAYWGWSDLD